MQRMHLILIIILSCTVGIGAALLAYDWYVLDVQVTPVEFKVTAGQDIGFNIDPGKLAFGKVPQAGVADRKATLESRVDAKAHISASPDWVTANVTELDLVAGVPQQVMFTLQVPADATPGNYTGSVRIVYTRS